MLFALAARTLWMVLVPAIWGLPTPTGSLPKQSGVETTESLIVKLGSPRFKERDEAYRVLLTRESAIPALKALQSKSLEVTRRAASLLEQFERRRIQRWSDKLDDLIDRGVVDLFAEVVARWPLGFQEEVCRDATYRLIHTLEGLHRKKGGKLIVFPFLEDKAQLPRVVVGTHIHTIPRGEKFCFLRASEVRLNNDGSDHLIIASGFVEALRGACGIITGGSVEARSAWNAVIVSGGDVTLDDAKNSLVIARGKISCRFMARDSQFVSGETVVLGNKVEKTIPTTNCIIQEKVARPLGFVRFFDPAEEGVAGEAADGGVRVQQVHAAKRFARAGLKAGDLITAVDDVATPNPDAFRLALRRALVSDDGLTLRLVRAGKTLDLRVPAPR